MLLPFAQPAERNTGLSQGGSRFGGMPTGPSDVFHLIPKLVRGENPAARELVPRTS